MALSSNVISSAKVVERREAKILEHLAKIRPIRDPWTGKTIWKDVQEGLIYRRIVGGIAWPSPDSMSPMTHLAILAEERDEDFTTGKHKVHILYEDMAPTIEEALTLAVEKQQTMKFAEWVGPIGEPEMLRVQAWRREHEKLRLPYVRLMAPPTVDFLALHALMQGRTTTNKTFYFGADSVAASVYVSVPSEDFFRPIKRYPQLAAVLFPLAVIDMYTAVSTPNFHVPAEGGY